MVDASRLFLFTFFMKKNPSNQIHAIHIQQTWGAGKLAYTAKS
jgi:hypothetical protein